MAKKKAGNGLDPELVETIGELLKECRKKTSTLSLDEKLSIIDRGLKLEAAKARLEDDEEGSEFAEPGEK